MGDALIVEAHAVDDTACAAVPEQPRGRITGLGPRGQRSDFHEGEAERCEGVDMIAILVEPRSKPDAMGKVEPHQPNRIRRWRRGERTGKPGPVQQRKAAEGNAVCGFRRQGEQRSCNQRIHHDSGCGMVAVRGGRIAP